MSNYPTIWFLRHGQTQWNLEGRLQGHLDSPLTELGLSQAAQQSDILEPIFNTSEGQAATLYVSPLGRAQDTARVALKGAVAQVDPRLAEVATGDWEGQLRVDVAQNPKEPALLLYTSAPNGEGFDAFEARVQSFLDDLTGPAIVVSHGLWGQVLRGLFCGLDRSAMAALDN